MAKRLPIDRRTPLSGTAAGAYMREWMDMYAVSSWLKVGGHLYGTAMKRHDDVRREYKVEQEPDSEGQCNIYERAINSDDDWQWVDAITIPPK